MDKRYRLKYQGKWMKVDKVLGTCVYTLFDAPEDIPAVSFTKINCQRGLVCNDNNLEIDDVKIVEV